MGGGEVSRDWGTRVGQGRSGVGGCDARNLENNYGGRRIPQEIKDKFLFWTADNAADESCAHDLVRAELQNLTFDDPDDTHSVMLAIKNGCAGDPEVELVQQVMLTNKRPFKSISNLLQHSSRLRSDYKEEQIDATLVTLSNLGWAPQRHSSRSSSLANASLTIQAVLSFVARGANVGNPTTSKSCVYNLDVFSKGPGRLQLAGMLADFCVEHHTAARQTDASDPEPTDLIRYLTRFENRIKFLFIEGNIMITPNTYTEKMTDVFEKGSVLTAANRNVAFALPSRQDACYFDPLERMRSIARNVLACLVAALPLNCWQRAFQGFVLPSPLGNYRHKPFAPSLVEDVRDKLKRIFRQAKHEKPENTLKEIETLAPVAEQYQAEFGYSARASWAAASLDMPELLLGRDGVSLAIVFSPLDERHRTRPKTSVHAHSALSLRTPRLLARRVPLRCSRARVEHYRAHEARVQARWRDLGSD